MTTPYRRLHRDLLSSQINLRSAGILQVDLRTGLTTKYAAMSEVKRYVQLRYGYCQLQEVLTPAGGGHTVSFLYSILSDKSNR